MSESIIVPTISCPLKTVDTDSFTGTRYYISETDERYISVTTLLKHYEDLNTLYNWQERVGKEEADKIGSDSVNIGNLSHSQIEKYLATGLIEEDFTSYSKNTIRHFYSRTHPVLFEEAFLYQDKGNPELKYGGRFDQLLYLKDKFNPVDDPDYDITGKYIIADLKTKRKSIRLDRADYVFKYCLQQAAYYKAVNSAQKEIEVTGGVVVVATKQTVRLLYLDKELLEYYWDIFYRMLLDYYLIEPINKSWKQMVDDASMYYDENTQSISSRMPRLII